jgi:transcriptional regulator with XRE-family HTH domain
MVDYDEVSAFARSVGNVLRTERELRRWTQAEAGHRIGLSNSVVCRMERGSRQLDMRRLVEWCAALNVPPAWVITVAQDDAFPFGWPGSYLLSMPAYSSQQITAAPARADKHAAMPQSRGHA